jgi:hypothetical protein
VIGDYNAGNPFDAPIVGCYEGPQRQSPQRLHPALALCDLSLLKELTTEKCPFADLLDKRQYFYPLTRDEMQSCQWRKPQLVAQIELTEWTLDGYLRHSSFVGLRSDK